MTKELLIIVSKNNELASKQLSLEDRYINILVIAAELCFTLPLVVALASIEFPILTEGV